MLAAVKTYHSGQNVDVVTPIVVDYSKENGQRILKVPTYPPLQGMKFVTKSPYSSRIAHRNGPGKIFTTTKLLLK